ncbi:MAG: glycoside hydrolase family 65 protein [Anaerolineaceae bacterium]|nr:glycoside hydrolase family 65 protein [Anaerolineaceae bacterium]
MDKFPNFSLAELGPVSPWILEEQGKIDSATVERLGNKLLIGNGYFGYRGTLAEYDKSYKTATIISGLYDQVADAWREPLNFPNGGYFQILHDGKTLHAMHSDVIHHAQQIDMKQAIHERETRFRISDQHHIQIRTQRFASLAKKELLCMAIQITSNQDCTITIRSGIDADVWDINGPHLEEIQLIASGQYLFASAKTHEQHLPITVAEYCSLNDDSAEILEEEKHIVRNTEIKLSAKQPLMLSKFIAHVTGADSTTVQSAANQLCQQAAEAGYAALLKDHAQEWQKRWQSCNVKIEGDIQADQALRFSLYHLLSITPTHTEKVSIPARGLSGQMYKGAIFWDTEIFMLPFFTHTFPQLARNLLMYRCHTLAGARRKAEAYGYRGAFFAWESQDNGDDACTLFNVTDVFTNRPMRTYFRDKQIHISADVVYAFWQYAQLSGDTTLWVDGGAELVLSCAQFYLSCTYYNPEKDRYEFLDVTGPDEYHERVHNNTFTNWMIWQTMQIGLQVADWCKSEAPEVYQHIFSTPTVQDDLARMRNMTGKIYRPGADQDQIIPQFDGYLSLEDISLKDLLASKLNPHEYLGGGNGLATTTQILKQADVILALFLFPDVFSEHSKRINWEYYEPRTEHGSSLSACSYSIIAAQIGKKDWAYRYFLKTARIDITGTGKQYVGPLYIGGTHPAANGGAWMSAVFGLCGLHATFEKLSINPHLPDQWQSIEFPLQYKGQPLVIAINFEQIKIQAVQPVTQAITIAIGKQTYLLDAETTSIDCKYYL